MKKKTLWSEILRTTLFVTMVCSTQRATALAQEPQANQAPDPQLEQIQDKYAAEYKKLEDQGQTISENAPKGAENAVGVDVDLSKWHDVSFDVPEFRMQQEHIAFDLPTATMKTRRIVWGNPEVKMENRVVGSYPEFHGFKVVWKHIITKVPVTKLVQREARLDIPEFSMHRTDMIFGVPTVFKMRLVKFRVPDIKVRSTAQAKEEMEDASKDIEDSATALATAERKEIAAASIEKLKKQKSELEFQQVQAVTQIADAIKRARDGGANPSDLKMDDGTKINLSAQLETVGKQFSDALKQIDDAIAQLQSDAGTIPKV